MNKLHFTKGSGKMKGLGSINTPTSTNPFCQKMAKTDTVCKQCYASRYEKIRNHLVSAFTRNLDILLKKDYEPESNINARIVRLHSFGELHNLRHFKNFVKLVRVNPETTFTIWTKRKEIITRFIKQGGVIPANFILIYSNPKINKIISSVPVNFDKVFNVMNKKFSETNGIEINCGARDCLSCMKCYSHNDIAIINEKLK